MMKAVVSRLPRWRDAQGLLNSLRPADGNDIGKKERDGEVIRLKRFEDFWIDTPLYLRGSPFPSEIYKNAMEQHKHCDTLSLAILSGALIIACYPHTKLDYACPDMAGAIILLGSGMLAAGLFALYFRFAAFAHVARLVMRGIELGWTPGFSYNNERFYDDRWPALRIFRASRVIAVLASLLITTNLLLAAVFIRQA